MRQGDGYRFRGRGIKQLTHRYNYADFQSYYNKHYPNDTKDFLNNEEHRKALLDNGKIALLSAVWAWNDKKCSADAKNYPEISIFRGKHLYEIANDETNGNVATTRKAGKKEIHTIKSVLAISVSVNGGTNGLDDRTKQHARIKSQNIFKDF